jgi:hypothetical protein
MRIAWPELIVLIVFAVLFVIAGEMGLIVAARVYCVPGWIVACGFVAGLFLDLWGALRLIDWAFAGPARRSRHRMP